jgi:hypothetical protein
MVRRPEDGERTRRRQSDGGKYSNALTKRTMSTMIG